LTWKVTPWAASTEPLHLNGKVRNNGQSTSEASFEKGSER
jgi:hypothetical protein